MLLQYHYRYRSNFAVSFYRPTVLPQSAFPRKLPRLPRYNRIPNYRVISSTVTVRGRMPTVLHGPGCNLGSGRGCPFVVHYCADLQSVHGLRCYGNITRTPVTTLRPSRDMMTARTLGGVCARCWPATGGWSGAFSKLCAVYGQWAWLTGRRRGGGVLNITAVVWISAFQWWRSGNITRTQNVSEYMVVLDLCLVTIISRAAIGLLRTYRYGPLLQTE